jgi:uncharacterized protein (TIGR03435 family)
MQVRVLSLLLGGVGLCALVTPDRGAASWWSGPRLAHSERQAPTQTGDGPTVEPNVSRATGRGTFRLRPGRALTATNVTLEELIAYAYQRHAFDQRQITGAPQWASVARFNLTLPLPQQLDVSPDGALHGVWSAVREVLTDRFDIKVHEELLQQSVYVLKRDPDGSTAAHLRSTEIDCAVAMRASRPPVGAYGPACGMKTPPGRLFANTISMPTLASLLSRYVDRPVIEQTGLAGRFDVALEAKEIVAAADYEPGPSDLALPPSAGPSILIAVREQLGLRLEPTSGMVSVIVVDRATKPSVR